MKSGCQKTEKAKKLLNNQEFSVLAENERQGFIQVILRLNENIEKQNKTIETLLKKLDEVEKELSLTRAKLRLSNSNIYGRRSESLYPSEKGGPIQHYFDFDSDTPYPVKPASEETTKVSDSIKPEKSEEKKAEPVMTAVAAYTRAKTGRKPLSPDLPRIIVTHDVPEEDKICACGCQKIIMKEIVSEKLVKPRSSPYVIKDIRYARVCPECEGTATEGISPTVETAPVQNQLISKSIATSSLVADIMDLKFNNSLPFYRISNMLKTDGISVTRATMCNWTIKISARLKPMMELFHEKLMESSVIFADETTLQVNKEPGRKPSSKSYVWVLRSGGINAPPTVYFHYEPSRAQKVAIKLLSGYKGHLMTDYYDKLIIPIN